MIGVAPALEIIGAYESYNGENNKALSPGLSRPRKADASASVAPRVMRVSVFQSTGMEECRMLCSATAFRSSGTPINGGY